MQTFLSQQEAQRLKELAAQEKSLESKEREELEQLRLKVQ